jgi:hypothetical protein
VLQRIVLAVCALGIAQAASIQLQDGAFRVTDWRPPAAAPADGWASVFAVFVGDGEVPPLLGAYSVESGVLHFRPRYPLQAGMRYRASFRPPDRAPLEASFEIPRPATGPATRVERVYPSTSSLPSNQLKFYVQFTSSMGRGNAWQHIRLVDQSGATVDLPFLELGQELWDREYRRLTVLFDPGRIKRGLLPLEEAGPNIEPGNEYTLVIDRAWTDARGLPLQEEFRKTFRVGAEDRTPPDPKNWRLTAPRAGTSEPLTLEFPEPLDYALLERLIGVNSPDGALPGSMEIDRQESRWQFTPREPWKPGNYRIEIGTALEDLAGNRIGRPFDVDVFERISKTLTSKSVSLRFRVR